MRGTKLMAWKIPPIWRDLQNGAAHTPERSKVLSNQKRLFASLRATLDAVCADVREGLTETVGIDCSLVLGETASVALDLPENSDAVLIARAIDLENVEAWRDAGDDKVHLAVSPFYSAKDVDQTVLCAVKVIHVLLGLHASDRAAKPETFGRKLLSSLTEVMVIQNKLKQDKERGS